MARRARVDRERVLVVVIVCITENRCMTMSGYSATMIPLSITTPGTLIPLRAEAISIPPPSTRSHGIISFDTPFYLTIRHPRLHDMLSAARAFPDETYSLLSIELSTR